MSADAPGPPPSDQPTPRRWRGVILFTIGALLAVAAVVAVATQGAGLSGVIDALRKSPPPLVALLLALPFFNWLCSAALFHVLTNRYGKVGAIEMGAVIASAWLLNYLPMRPGMIGRVAYHKKVNDIPIAASVQVLAFSIGLSGVAIVIMLVLTLLLGGTSSAQGATPGARAWIALCIPVILGTIATLWLRARASVSWRFVAGGVVKLADLLVWGVRYWACFAIVGVNLSPTEAAGIAAVTQLVLLIPLAGNGLGLREWVVGVVASSLPAWFAGAAAAPTRVEGLSADLVNRAAELLAALLVGVWGTMLVARNAAGGRKKP